MNNDLEMYATDDSEPDTVEQDVITDPQSINVENFSTTTLLTIGKHQVSVINPLYVTNLKHQLEQANRKIATMDRTLKRVTFELANAAKDIRRLQQEMDQKVDYE